MNIDLTGKTALVTGSTQGIGPAIAAGLARSGARVAVNGRTADRVESAVAELRSTGADTHGVTAAAQLVDPALPWDQAQRGFMCVHRPQSLIQRLIEPEEIANMVVYLSAPFASTTTGGALRVDGGYVDSILP
ncbi:SDR family oxidoreductase [Nocardia sp. NPDC059764]|uniref:SDR family oxidoreductase n=1 Tax=Nocardia sp. NPDC059764 TaxID=3346939 RepID=UPI003663F6FF